MMHWKRRMIAIGAAITVAAAAGPSVWIVAESNPPETVAAASETVESSGKILGIQIGSQIADARAMLDPLRIPSAEPPDAKEKAAKRVYWKLNGTEFDWLIAWANSKGEITRLRANLRPGTTKPFAEIGDLSRATVDTPERAMWNVTRPGEPAFRLIAQGSDRRAVTFYMFALNLEMR